MTTNKEWLYSLQPDELAAWFDAQHVDDNDALAHKNDVSGGALDANDANVAQDSREKLEADANRLVDVFTESYSDHSELFGEIIGLLDRQAAITANGLVSLSVDEESPIKGENATSKCDMHDFDDTREKLEDDIQSDLAALSEYGKLMLDWYVVMDWLDRQAAIDRKEFQSILEEIQTCMRNGSR